MTNGPYLIELPANGGKVSNAQGAKVYAPDGTQLTNILGARIELAPNEVLVAYIKVPVRVVER